MSGETRLGDWKIVCDLSGFTGWASESVLTWDNKRVLRRFVGSEVTRHPQEDTTPPAIEQPIPWARPVATYVFRDATSVRPSDL